MEEVFFGWTLAADFAIGAPPLAFSRKMDHLSRGTRLKGMRAW